MTTAATKRALVLAPAGPPSGGSHATRIAALIEALGNRGIDATFLTVNWSDAEKCGSQQFKRVAAVAAIDEVDGGVFRTAARRVGRVGQRKGRFQGAVQQLRAFTRARMIPDTYAAWIPNAIRAGLSRHANKPFDVVISSGAPFSSHVAAYVISRRTGLPLVLDYGDPWVFEPGRPRRGLRLCLERRLERRVLAQASLASVTTKATIELYRERYPGLVTPIILAPMGFDRNDFEPCSESRPSSETQRRLRLAYTGRINEEYRSIEDFLDALRRARYSPDEYRFDFYGPEFGSIELELGKFEKAELIRFNGSVDHPDYINILQTCDGLLMFGNNNCVQIPGKLADYLAARKNILYFPNIPDEDQDPTLTLARKVQQQGVFVGREEGAVDRFLEACASRDPIQDELELAKLDWKSCFEELIVSLEPLIVKHRLANT